MNMKVVELKNLTNTLFVIRHGNHYGCVQDKNHNIIIKGFDTEDDAIRWISEKVEYPSRWIQYGLEDLERFIKNED